MKAHFLLFPILLFAFSCTGHSSHSEEEAKRDVSKVSLLDNINKKTSPRYKLYQTENIWTFIELETYTGRMWQVQYTLDDSKMVRGKVELNASNLAGGERNEYAGRFELYPTQNIYNFILLDTQTGKTWQTQWSFNAENRGIVEIEPIQRD